MEHHLAEINVARLRHPLDHAETAEFVAALDPINELAESSDGFIWRLEDETGQSSSFVPVDQIDDPLEIVNYSIWRDLEALEQYVFKSHHVDFLRRRRDWFERGDQAATCCWWVPVGTIPSVSDAYGRLQHLREHGPSARAWPLNRPHPPPDSDEPGPDPTAPEGSAGR